MAKNKFTRSNLDQTVETVYDFIVKYIKKEGYPPSVREICAGVDVRSTSTIHSHLRRLQESGRIDYTPGRRRAIIVNDLQKETISSLPLVGMVTAGVPILAQENIERMIPFSSELYTDGDHFVLKVRGDSMIDAHILDGDYVVVKKQNSATSGEIVVALIDDEATVKTLSMHDGKVVLLPKNPAYEPIAFSGDGCQILGIVKGLFRSAI